MFFIRQNKNQHGYSSSKGSKGEDLKVFLKEYKRVYISIRLKIAA